MKYLTKLALPEKGDRVAPIHPVLGVYQLYRHLYRVVRRHSWTDCNL